MNNSARSKSSGEGKVKTPIDTTMIGYCARKA